MLLHPTHPPPEGVAARAWAACRSLRPKQINSIEPLRDTWGGSCASRAAGAGWRSVFGLEMQDGFSCTVSCNCFLLAVKFEQLVFQSQLYEVSPQKHTFLEHGRNCHVWTNVQFVPSFPPQTWVDRNMVSYQLAQINVENQLKQLNCKSVEFPQPTSYLGEPCPSRQIARVQDWTSTQQRLLAATARCGARGQGPSKRNTKKYSLIEQPCSATPLDLTHTVWGLLPG